VRCKGKSLYYHISGVCAQNVVRLGGCADFLRPFIWVVCLARRDFVMIRQKNSNSIKFCANLGKKVWQRPWQWIYKPSEKKACHTSRLKTETDAVSEMLCYFLSLGNRTVIKSKNPSNQKSRYYQNRSPLMSTCIMVWIALHDISCRKPLWYRSLDRFTGYMCSIRSSASQLPWGSLFTFPLGQLNVCYKNKKDVFFVLTPAENLSSFYPINYLTPVTQLYKYVLKLPHTGTRKIRPRKQ
jgi:hypothetical protein